MALKNVIFKNYSKDIKSYLDKEEKKKLRKAAKFAQKELEKESINRFGKTSNLTLGIDQKQLKHAALVGVGPPGYHAHLIEYGTDERYTQKGSPRGHVKAKPFVIPTFEKITPDIIRILEEAML